jgi:hypothetical protein
MSLLLRLPLAVERVIAADPEASCAVAEEEGDLDAAEAGGIARAVLEDARLIAVVAAEPVRCPKRLRTGGCPGR